MSAINKIPDDENSGNHTTQIQNTNTVIPTESLYTDTDIAAMKLLFPTIDMDSLCFSELSQYYLKMLESEQTFLCDISLRTRCKTSDEIKKIIGINTTEYDCKGIRCKRCKEYNVHYIHVQNRSADEAMTAKYQCRACKYTWST